MVWLVCVQAPFFPANHVSLEDCLSHHLRLRVKSHESNSIKSILCTFGALLRSPNPELVTKPCHHAVQKTDRAGYPPADGH